MDVIVAVYDENGEYGDSNLCAMRVRPITVLKTTIEPINSIRRVHKMRLLNSELYD